MWAWIAQKLITRAETRIGVKLDYARKIAQSDFALVLRYRKIFRFLDPNKNVPPAAYHTARLRGAIASDCGTCVEAEINIARSAGLSSEVIRGILRGDYSALPEEVRPVARLADAVVAHRMDDPQARSEIEAVYGTAGLIEICYAMNGAALLPGIKRAMGYSVTCDLDLLQKTA